MRVMKDAMENIVDHVSYVSSQLSDQQINKLIVSLEHAKKVYIYGAGRSGLVAKAFAMRLMHLGIAVHVVGEITTPAIEAEDIFITISGSGETTSVINSAKIAKNVGAQVISITSYPDSTLGKLSDEIVLVPGRVIDPGSKDFHIRQIKGEHYTLAPLGTLFEVSVLIILDALIAELMTRLKKSESDLKKRHATIE
ncbi:3-hexulose-6-phosphate isomerase [archaeon BMS3Abin16]|nr:3-hexulose-6-phosphate isomerase [archaeon BMS3Abin16]HDY73532.1 6-phospho-3-hexuloisomerase [Euryarchaeota archaeon]